MAVNRGSVPLLKQVLAERKGKPLSGSMKSQIRMALLKGEKLSNREVPGRFGVSVTAIYDAVQDLERVGYRFCRTETNDQGAVYWIENPRHVPKTDTGPVRKRPSRSRAAKAAKMTGSRNGRGRVAAVEVEEDWEGEMEEELPPAMLGDVFILCLSELGEDGSVTHTLRREDGRELLALEEPQ
jgi:hypothetical protein